MTPKLLYEHYSKDSNYFECQLPVIVETSKAICFDKSGSENQSPAWIPKSKMVITNLGKDAGVRYFIENYWSIKLK